MQSERFSGIGLWCKFKAFHFSCFRRVNLFTTILFLCPLPLASLCSAFFWLVSCWHLFSYGPLTLLHWIIVVYVITALLTNSKMTSFGAKLFWIFFFWSLFSLTCSILVHLLFLVFELLYFYLSLKVFLGLVLYKISVFVPVMWWSRVFAHCLIIS